MSAIGGLGESRVDERGQSKRKALQRHNDVEFALDGVQYKIRVPPEIVVEVEIEVDDDSTSLEIELSL